MKRIVLFLVTNLAVMLVLGVVLNLLGLNQFITANGLNMTTLLGFSLVVGFGGSMIWFGSSAGIAISNMYPEAKSVGRWIMAGWHIAVAYVIGFFVFLALLGWNPDADHKKRVDITPGMQSVAAASH